jgi:hypothetical protein
MQQECSNCTGVVGCAGSDVMQKLKSTVQLRQLIECACTWHPACGRQSATYTYHSKALLLNLRNQVLANPSSQCTQIATHVMAT